MIDIISPFDQTLETKAITEKNDRKQNKGKKSVATKTKSKKPPTKTECALLTFLLRPKKSTRAPNISIALSVNMPQNQFSEASTDPHGSQTIPM